MVRLGVGGPGRLSRAGRAELPNGNRLALGIGGFLFEEDNYYFCLTASVPLLSGKHPTFLRDHPSPTLRLCSSVGLPLSLAAGEGCDPGRARQSELG